LLGESLFSLSSLSLSFSLLLSFHLTDSEFFFGGGGGDGRLGWECGWEWEREALRIPSTRAWGIVGSSRFLFSLTPLPLFLFPSPSHPTKPSSPLLSSLPPFHPPSSSFSLLFSGRKRLPLTPSQDLLTRQHVLSLVERVRNGEGGGFKARRAEGKAGDLDEEEERLRVEEREREREGQEEEEEGRGQGGGLVEEMGRVVLVEEA